MESYCVLGVRDGYTRYAVLERGVIVATQISRPDGQEVPTPHPLRFARRAPEEVQIKTWRINETPVAHNGEQPRRPIWRRAGRTAAAQ